MLSTPFPYLNLNKIIEEFQSIDLAFPGAESYLMSYAAFVRFFNKNLKQQLTEDDLVIGIHFAYGWMPTIFEFKHADLNAAVTIINQAKNSELLTKAELTVLKTLLNNSIVGTSKLLHFISPANYAIWDSRVYRFVTGKEKLDHSKVNSISLYAAYLEHIRELVKEEQFKIQVHQPLCEQLKQEISPLRVLELVLFLGGPNKKTALI
jgi:hypothetical protein